MKRNGVIRMAGGVLVGAVTFVVARAPTVAHAASPEYCWPCRGPIPPNGRFDDPRIGHVHQGLDIAASESVAVQAASPGKVTVAGWMNGYRQVVFIDHGGG
jgi:septal ring factor EnvC (AmiA/AmiB activator)